MTYTRYSYYGSCVHKWSWTYGDVHVEHREKIRRPPDWLGFSVWGSLGREVMHHSETAGRAGFPLRHGPGGCIDVNAPMGEPNRAAVHGAGWMVTLGLPSVRDFRKTGEETAIIGGREIPVIRGEHFSNWLHPHIDGLDRYRYHQEDGRWVRNDRPERRHWGWLTIERRRGCAECKSRFIPPAVPGT